MTIYILYSADYELFLGGNYYDEKKVLIDPTNDLLNLFDNLKIPLTLFADIFSILRYKEQKLFSFPNYAENQLKEAIRRGHDVQSHVHPHWNYTQIEGNRYDINLDYYLLGKLDDNKEALYSKILNYLLTSRNYLHNLLHEVDKNYNCIAFRSGGYGLQPNSDVVIKALKDSGFRIDSSIVPGFIFKTNVSDINFSNVPKNANYYLDYNLSIPSLENQGIFEIPIASHTFNVIENSFFKITDLLAILQNKAIRKLTSYQPKEKGYPIQQLGNIPCHSKYDNFLKFFNNRFYYLECSIYDEIMFQLTKNYLMQFDCNNTNIFFSFNMHPKEMTKEHYSALVRYHNKIKKQYKDNIQAISYQQASEMLTKVRVTF
jgi:hypothetical protein